MGLGLIDYVQNTINAGKRWYAGDIDTYSKDNSDGMLVVTWLDQLDGSLLTSGQEDAWMLEFEAEFVNRYEYQPKDVRYVIGKADPNNLPNLRVTPDNLNGSILIISGGDTGSSGTSGTGGTGTGGGLGEGSGRTIAGDDSGDTGGTGGTGGTGTGNTGIGTVGGAVTSGGTSGSGNTNTGSGNTNTGSGTTDNTTACPTYYVCVPTVNVPEATRSLAGANNTDTETKTTIDGITKDADKIDRIICSTTLVDSLLEFDENVLDKYDFTNLTPQTKEQFKNLQQRMSGLFEDNPLKIKDAAEGNIKELTEKLVEGQGVFDWIMGSVYNHLDNLRKNNLISAQEFTAIYSQNITEFLNIASNHLISGQQSFWNNQLIREQVISAKIANLKAQAELVMLPLVLEKQFAETQQVIKQVDLLNVQVESERIKIPQIQAQTANIIEQTRLTEAQWHKTAKEAKLVDVTMLDIKANIKLKGEQLKKEQQNIDLIKAQAAEAYTRIALTSEQIKAAKAQYSDTIDGQPVRGIIGTQNALHRKQSLSYDRDSLYKLISVQAQGWQTKKTADIGTKSPAVFTAASLDGMFEEYLATYYNNANTEYNALGTDAVVTANGNGSEGVFGRVNISRIKPISGYSDYVTDSEMDAEVPTKIGNTVL